MLSFHTDRNFSTAKKVNVSVDCIYWMPLPTGNTTVSVIILPRLNFFTYVKPPAISPLIQLELRGKERACRPLRDAAIVIKI